MPQKILDLRHRVIRPQQIARIAGGNPLTKSCRYLSLCESPWLRDLVSNTRGVPSTVTANSTFATMDGFGTGFLTGYNEIAIANTIDDIVPLDKCTIVMAKRKWATGGGCHFGSPTFDATRVRILAPWSDSKIYFNWTTSWAESGVLSWTLPMDYFVFVAGPDKGIEIWRNGYKEGSAAYPGARSANSATAALGSTTNSIEGTTFTLFGIFDAEWSDGQIANWFRAPYQLFEQRRSFAISLLPAVTVSPTVGNVVVTGDTPTLVESGTLVVQPTVGAVLVTGGTPTLDYAITYSTPTVGSVVVTGETPTLVSGTFITPSSGDVLVTGETPTVLRSINIEPTIGDVVVTGETPTLLVTHTFVEATRYFDSEYDLAAWSEGIKYLDSSYDLPAWSEQVRYLDPHYDLGAYQSRTRWLDNSYDLKAPTLAGRYLDAEYDLAYVRLETRYLDSSFDLNSFEVKTRYLDGIYDLRSAALSTRYLDSSFDLNAWTASTKYFDNSYDIKAPTTAIRYADFRYDLSVYGAATRYFDSSFDLNAYEAKVRYADFNYDVAAPVEATRYLDSVYDLNLRQTQYRFLDLHYDIKAIELQTKFADVQYDLQSFTPQIRYLDGQYDFAVVATISRYLDFVYDLNAPSVQTRYVDLTYDIRLYLTAGKYLDLHYDLGAFRQQTRFVDFLFELKAFESRIRYLDSEYDLLSYVAGGQVRYIDVHYDMSVFALQTRWVDIVYDLAGIETQSRYLDTSYDVAIFETLTKFFDAAYDLLANEVFYAWAINLQNKGMSKYEGFNFNSLGYRFGAAADGIYVLSGDTDNGANISAFVDSGRRNFVNPDFPKVQDYTIKSVTDYWLCSNGTNMSLLVDTDSGTYTYAITPTASIPLQPSKTSIGGGLEGARWRFVLSNVSGTKATIGQQDIGYDDTQKRSRYGG